MPALDPALERVIVTHLRSWYRELFELALLGATIGNENELLEGLARVLPWATLGYTAEIEAAFRKAPAALRIPSRA
jgi:hypothetical protein